MLKYNAKQKEEMLKLLVMKTTINLKKFLITMVSFILWSARDCSSWCKSSLLNNLTEEIMFKDSDWVCPIMVLSFSTILFRTSNF